MKKTLITIIVLLIIIVAAVAFMRKDNAVENTSTGTDTTTGVVDTTATSTTGTTASTTGVSAANVKEFKVIGTNFSFDKKEIRVKKGDTVKIVFNNVEGFHDWKVDEFNAATKRIQAGQTDTVTFVADKAGTFEYYCSVGTHRQFGMRGNLIVE